MTGVLLSWVVAGRNDGYGGDFLHRMNVFLHVLCRLIDRYAVSAEIVIVEWNPPADRPRFREALDWPRALPAGLVRIVEVPAACHAGLPNAEKMPIFEYIAKNVGIRRARGEFVLVTNPDIIFSEPLVRFLKSGALSHSCFYRTDRYDVSATVSLEDLQRRSPDYRRHVARVNTLGGTLDLRYPPIGLGRVHLAWRLFRHRRHVRKVRTAGLASRLHTNASGDFFLMAGEQWHHLRGYPEFPTASHIDGYMCVMAASAGLREVVLPDRMSIYHQEHERAMDLRRGKISRPMTSYEKWERDCEEMLRTGRPMLFNGEDWGLGDSALTEANVKTAG
jgi:hypothetical protein